MARIASKPNKPSWQQALPGMVLLLLVLLAYGPALHAGFIWDDDKYVTDNPLLTDPHGLKQIWFSAHTQSQYFPLVYTTFRLEHSLWSLDPAGYHLVNVLLHGVNAVLVWLLLGRLKIPGAWLAAAIFALHPVQVESVAWVSELKNVESLFFSLLALMAWLKAIEATTAEGIPIGPQPTGSPQQAVKNKSSVGSQAAKIFGRFWPWYLLALAAYQTALFAKTTACTLPVALALILWLRGKRLASWRWGGLIAPFVVLGIAMGLVSIWWEGNLGSYNAELGLSFSLMQRILMAGRAFWFYAGKLIWPVNLTFSYPRWEINPSAPVQYIPVAGFILACILLWIWRRRLGARVVAGVIFFAATLVPLVGFISNYTFQYSFVADHYEYVASIGLISILAGVLTSWYSRVRMPGALTVVCSLGLLALLGWLTSTQCGAYLSSETLWRDTLAKNPASWMAHHNLAVDLQEQGKLEEAMEHYRAAIALNPKHLMAHNNLGLALAGRGQFTEAIEHYQAALSVDPNFAEAHNNLAVALAERGDFAGAVSHLRRAIEIDPTMMGAWLNLGRFLEAQGKNQEALDTFRKAASLFPNEIEPSKNLVRLLAKLGQTSAAR